MLVAAFFDFIAVFPSADHAFFFEVMGRCGIPVGAISVARSLYEASTLLIAGASGTKEFTKRRC